MGTSYLGRSIVRASAMAFALMFARVTIGTAQAANGVRCADGFVAPTAAICNRAHQGVIKADARMSVPMAIDTAHVSGRQNGLKSDSDVTDYRQGASPGAHPIKAPTPQSNPWPAIPTKTGVVQWPATGTSGRSSEVPSAISLPPGVVIPPDSQTKRQKRKSP
jgi:hypothetical protein